MGTKGNLYQMLYLSCKMSKKIFGFSSKWRAEKNATHTYSRKNFGQTAKQQIFLKPPEN